MPDIQPPLPTGQPLGQPFGQPSDPAFGPPPAGPPLGQPATAAAAAVMPRHLYGTRAALFYLLREDALAAPVQDSGRIAPSPGQAAIAGHPVSSAASSGAPSGATSGAPSGAKVLPFPEDRTPHSQAAHSQAAQDPAAQSQAALDAMLTSDSFDFRL